MSETAKVTYVLIAVCLVFRSLPSHAQPAKDQLQKADRYYLKKDYRNALKHFEEVLTIDPDNLMANYKAGISSLDQKKFTEAIGYLEKVFRIKPDVDPDIDYHLGVAYQNGHRYSEARRHFESLRGKNKRLAPVASRKIAECIAGDSIMKLPRIAEVKSLEGDINTNFSEFAPLISPDGGTLIFSSDRSADPYEIKSRTNPDDVYVSQKKGAIWESAEKIGENINVRSNEVATSISADGKTLFLYYEDGGGDIYTSTKEEGRWSKPVPLNRFINHPEFRESSAYVSADGKRLFFSSNRPGGKGGFDIYVSEMTANGQWGRPANLGSSINTRGDEISPFIHADGKTLYFASNGHATLGDHDLFRSTFVNGRWTAPENLGYPVNTSGYEAFLVLQPDHSTGYFTSRRKTGETDTDLYHVSLLPDSPMAEKADDDDTGDGIVSVLKGSVVDITDATPVQATITLVDNATKQLVSKTRTDISGSFQIIIPHGGNYGLTTEKSGYLFNSMNFDLPPFEKYQEIDTHILMVKADVGSKVVLKNVFFDVNQATLKPESLTELENIRDLLIQNPRWKIRINGHTDNSGYAEANRTLSLKRAQAVVEYLIRQGIASARLEAKGYGSERPLVSNDDEMEGRQINRRTEIEIID